MQKLQIFLLAAIVLGLSSCQIVGNIFKAGVGVGVFIVVAIVGLVIFLIAKVGGGR